MSRATGSPWGSAPCLSRSQATRTPDSARRPPASSPCSRSRRASRPSGSIAAGPETARPFYSAQVVLLLQYGVVRFELELDLVGDGSRTVVIPDPTLPEAAPPGPGVRN